MRIITIFIALLFFSCGKERYKGPGSIIPDYIEAIEGDYSGHLKKVINNDTIIDSNLIVNVRSAIHGSSFSPDNVSQQDRISIDAYPVEKHATVDEQTLSFEYGNIHLILYEGDTTSTFDSEHTIQGQFYLNPKQMAYVIKHVDSTVNDTVYHFIGFEY